MNRPAGKKAWRATLAAARDRLTPQDWEPVLHQAGVWVQGRTPGRLHAYLAKAGSSEPDLMEFLLHCSAMGWEITLPMVHPGRFGRMQARLWTPDATLVPNGWGIPEPVSGLPVPWVAHDLMLVPALGVDAAGYRLGYGGGYYDRVLAHCPAETAVLAPASLRVERLPHESHDVPVKAVITETGIHHPYLLS